MKKVLIVDDAMFMRHTLKTMLEKNNYQIIGMAEDGEEALMRCKELRPDIITLDITMPKMSGLQALVEIKKINKDIKVVMITAMGQEMLMKEALLNGASNFIVKPFREKTIIDVLNSL
ncbi:MAG: response regulator [Acidaminobacteraceae bacterium]